MSIMGFLFEPTKIMLSFLFCLLLSILPIVWNVVVHKRRLKNTACVVPATATPYNYIPNDLVMEIVSRLPANSVLKFRSVSKSWRSLLSDKSLENRVLPPCMTHLIYTERRAGEEVSFAYCISVKNTNESKCTRRSLRLVCEDCIYKDRLISDVCNIGLVLSCINYKEERGEYMAWNPINNSYIALLPAPDASEKDYVRYKHLTSLQYDPRTSHHFKVVCFLPVGEDPLQFVMAIFSSEVGQWVFSNTIMSISPLPNFMKSISRKPAFLHGALYVMFPSTHLVQFDFSKETFHVIKLPEGEVDSSSCFGVSRGRLYYALICNDEKLRVWILQDISTGKWALRHTAGLKKLAKKLVGETPEHGYKDLLAKSCFNPDEEAIYFVVGKSIFCYVMWRGIVNFVHKSQWIPYTLFGLSTFSPCLVNLFERYNLDDAQKKQQVKKQWCFKELRQS